MNEPLARPMFCVVCKARGSYYGRLIFPEEFAGDPPVCPNHPAGMEPRLVRPRNGKN